MAVRAGWEAVRPVGEDLDGREFRQDELLCGQVCSLAVKGFEREEGGVA